MAAQDSDSPPRIYQIKVSLVGISPLIWRRLLVPDTTSIAELHYILQIAMGWEDYHLHRFSDLRQRLWHQSDGRDGLFR